MKVLIIDDEPYVITVVRLLVDWNQLGIDAILSCGSAEEALELIRSHHPEIILSDINLPGLSGLDLIEQIKNQGISPQIILITAYSDFSYAQRAIKLDCVDYLLKPLEEDALNKALTKALRSLEEAASNKSSSVQMHKVVDSVPEEGSPLYSTADICRAVHHFLRSHYQEDLNLDRLSQRFGISPSHLSRSYKKEMGIGLIDDLTFVRLEASKELLCRGFSTVETSDTIGFTDSKYFNRVFKKYYHCTPGEYRKKVSSHE